MCAASTRNAITPWLGTTPAMTFSIDQRCSSVWESGLWMRRRGKFCVAASRYDASTSSTASAIGTRPRASSVVSTSVVGVICLFDRDACFLGQLAPALELVFDIGGKRFGRAAKGLGAENDKKFAHFRRGERGARLGAQAINNRLRRSGRSEQPEPGHNVKAWQAG